MSNVILVVMPFAAIEHPAIGPSLLKARLTEENIDSEVLYANLRFAGDIGIRTYWLVSNGTLRLLGEWIFAQAAFPDFNPNPDAYLDAIRFPLSSEKLLALRIQAMDFVDRLAAEILEKNPKIVGCSSMFQQNCASLALLHRIKKLAPEVITVMGGANCEGNLGLAMIRLFPYLDFAVSGEADYSFPALCKQLLLDDFAGSEALDSLPEGVYCRRERSDTTLGSRRRAFVPHLDRLPPPDYDDYFSEVAISPIRSEFVPGLLFETSRGCWWGQKHQCSFCGLNGDGINYRRKSPGRVYDELLALGTRYQQWGFQAVDNIVDMKLVKELQPRLSTLPQLPSFMFETKANMTRKHVKLLREARIQWIQPGIENLHDEMLRLLNKGVHAWQNVALLKWAQEYGIHVIWNYLCLIPGDDDSAYADVAEWLPWIMHLQPQSGPGGTPLMYDRFGDYFRNREKHGLKLQPLSLYNFIYPFSPQEMGQLAYFYEIANPAHHQKERTGLNKLMGLLTLWHEKYFPIVSLNGVECIGEPSYSLNATVTQDGIAVTDTRACAVMPTQQWHGLDAAVLTVCDTALTFKGVGLNVEKLTGRKADENDILHSVTRLQQARILLRLNDRYLALTVNTPIHPKPPNEDMPGGRILIRKQKAAESKSQTILEFFGVE